MCHNPGRGRAHSPGIDRRRRRRRPRRRARDQRRLGARPARPRRGGPCGTAAPATPTSAAAPRSTTRANGFDPHEIAARLRLGHDEPPAERPRRCASGSCRASTRRSRSRPGVTLRRLDLQRPHPRARRCAAARASGCGSRSSTAPRTRTRSTSTASTRPTMDGVPGLGAGQIAPGGQTVYEFDALPAGLHLYHCHVRPLAEHIAKGLYGAFIVDPTRRPRGRRRAGDGHERVRHELRPRERAVRGEHDPVRLHGPADRGRRAASWCASTSSTCSSTT